MENASSKRKAREEVCPYLHQLQMDWLSTDADGFYCRGVGGRVKTLSEGEVRCALPGFTACEEYRLLEGIARR